eukprot:2462140-Ditylum_brightwellii.AAC.1
MCNPRARAGVYLGHSPVHAGNVALVLNLETGHISPQYHIVFGNEFLTVPYLQSHETPPNWADLVAKHTEKATDQAFNLASTWYEGEEAARDDTMPQTPTEPTLVREQDRPFIDLDTIGLRRSPKIQAMAQKTKAAFLLLTTSALHSTTHVTNQ